MQQLPWVISVDDHVVEPPTVWSDRLPSAMRERGPRVVQDRCETIIEPRSKVARYVKCRWGVTVCPETGWRWLVDLGFTLQVPRPSHPKSADPPTRRAWKKT